MASTARDIRSNPEALARRVSRSMSFSTSPSAVFYSPPSGHTAAQAANAAALKPLKPFATEDIKILLLENVNQTGRDILLKQGYQVECLKSSLPEDELIEKIRFATCPSTGIELTTNLHRTAPHHTIGEAQD